MKQPRKPRRRPRLRGGIVILPSAFTMANLFFGIYAIVAASRGDFIWAGWFIVFAAILDVLDGRVARFTRTGSDFGAELDSLVDAISFGVAPGFIMFSLYFNDAHWSWTIAFLYIVAGVVRLARFNVEQGGEAKRHFLGLPSPTAGMLLATFYPFSQTPLFETYLSTLPWPQILGVSMVLLGALMISHVPYPMMPRISFQDRRATMLTGVLLGSMILSLTIPRYFFFPACTLYTLWGVGRSFALGLLERLPERDPLRDEPPEDDEETEQRALDYRDLIPDDYGPGYSENDERVEDAP